MVLPLTNFTTKSATKRALTIRPIKQSALDKFGQTIVQEGWLFLELNSSPTALVGEFQNHCSTLVEHFFPLKTVKISSFDKPFFNDRLRLLRRQRQREYRKSGRSIKYLKLKSEFLEAFEFEAHKHKEKVISEVVDGTRGSAYKALKKLCSKDDDTDTTFEIPSHLESNLSAEESAELLADYFSAISQEFEPIDPAKFSPSLMEKLAAQNEEVPIIEEHQVYQKIKAAKKPNSTVPGDLPKKVVNSFAVELAKPVAIIYNAITKMAEYPRQWVVENQTPIPKSYPPESEEDLRNISGTPFFSKLYESFLSDWLLPIVLPFLDPSNCGGLKGTSISHYLIRPLHFILHFFSVEKRQPHAAVFALIDLSKAFNRVDHSLVIEDLHDMKVPAWLLKILISYLTNRSMVIKYRGATSSVRSLPGSSPQGVFLGCFFFMIKFNGALLRPNIPRPFPKPTPVMDRNTSSCTVKYIDDASHAVAVDLKKSLIQLDLSDRPLPLQYHEHTGFILNPEMNQMQQDLDLLKRFTDQNLMVINQKKTQIMCVNFRTSRKFPPIFSIGDRKQLDIVNQTKLVGIIVSDDLRWSAHVEYTCTKASKKIWQLRRMKTLNLEHTILLDYYCKEIRSILEFGVAVWSSCITVRSSDAIERIQKICVNIILCDVNWEIPYEVGCTLLGIEPLKYRRVDVCIKFIQKASCDPRHSDLFSLNDSSINTRQEKLTYREFPYRTDRFYNSPLCYLTRLLNLNPTKQQSS